MEKFNMVLIKTVDIDTLMDLEILKLMNTLLVT